MSSDREQLECFNRPHYFDPSDRTDNFAKTSTVDLCASFPCPNRYTFYNDETTYSEEYPKPVPEQETLPEPASQNTGRFSALTS